MGYEMIDLDTTTMGDDLDAYVCCEVYHYLKSDMHMSGGTA
jgi:hypothetical protein